jgi:hypothetical protein
MHFGVIRGTKSENSLGDSGIIPGIHPLLRPHSGVRTHESGTIIIKEPKCSDATLALLKSRRNAPLNIATILADGVTRLGLPYIGDIGILRWFQAM